MPVDQINTRSSVAAQENVREFHHIEPDSFRPNRKKVAPGQLLISGEWRDSSDGATMATVLERAV